MGCIYNCDLDLMSLIELDHIMEQLGYKDCLGYYYANKKRELVWCLTYQTMLEMCNSLLKEQEVDVFVKHLEVLHLLEADIGSSNVCSQPTKSVCEGKDSRTNAAATPNVDEVVDEAEDSSKESEFVDDEYTVSDDDDLYDNYVDADEQWIGIKSNEEKKKGVEEENMTVNDVEGKKKLCDDDMRRLDSDNEEECKKDKPRYLQFEADIDMANL